MKSAYYLATVVSSYRRLIDQIYEKGSVTPSELDAIRFEIAKAENRQTGPGFYKGIPDETVQLYQDHDETVTQEYVAFVLEKKNVFWFLRGAFLIRKDRVGLLSIQRNEKRKLSFILFLVLVFSLINPIGLLPLLMEIRKRDWVIKGGLDEEEK